VQGEGGPIRLDPADDPTRIQVTEQGELLVPDGGDAGLRSIGKLRIGMVEDPNRLLRLSANYFRPAPDQSIETATGTRVCNGYQEESNVSPVREMAAMIQSLREFESGHKMVQTLTELARDESQKIG
jgi:flagellar basal body rod protein FlgG